VDKTEVDRWLRAYVEAWKSYDRDQIGELFAEDVRYRYHPYDDPVEGRDAVVRSWLGEEEHAGASTRDEEGTFVMRFDSAGRCREFTEWYVRRPGS